jgi:KUP system potassium uptake protein
MASIEGLKQIDGLELGISPILGITTVILVFIFVVQQFGTSFIGKFFGPVMVIWFLFLGTMGVINLQYHPEILKSFNPYYAFKLIVNSPNALWILGAVFLCTTGAEALYSDLGHCGAKNIRVSWFFVKIMLILNYLGQGSWLLENYNMVFTGTNPFFGMLPQFLIIPAVILATAAAIIASQALITGSFTIFSEAMSLNFWPFQQIEYPSGLKGQMYIPRINWGLLIMCIVVVFYFKESVHMEAAYGLSITVTMLMTTVLLIFWLWRNRVSKIFIGIFALVYFAIELGFFGTNITIVTIIAGV